MFTFQHELNGSNTHHLQNTFESEGSRMEYHHRDLLIPSGCHQDVSDSIYLTKSYMCRMVEIVCDLHEVIEGSLKRSEQVLEQAFIDFEQVVSTIPHYNTNLPLESDMSVYFDPKKLKQRLNILAVERLKALEQIHTSFLAPLLKLISSQKNGEENSPEPNLNHNSHVQPPQSSIQSPLTSNFSNILQVPTTPVKNNRLSTVKENRELVALQKILEHLKTKLDNEKNPSQQNVLRVDIQKIEKEIFMLESGCFLSPIVKQQHNMYHHIQGKKVKPLFLDEYSPSTTPSIPQIDLERVNSSSVTSIKKQEGSRDVCDSQDHSGYWSVTSSLTEKNHQADLNSQLFESMIFEDTPSLVVTEKEKEQHSFMSTPPGENAMASDSDSDMEHQDFLTSQFLSPGRGSTEKTTPQELINVTIPKNANETKKNIRTPTHKQKQPDVTPSPVRKPPTPNLPSKLPSRPNSAKSKAPEKPQSPKNSTQEERHKPPKSFKHMKENIKILPNHTGLSDSIRIGIGTTEKKKEIKPWY
ncbi:hypothetical protein C9374_003653 [Naegleria lovaniensis]|uniref:Uncharacterized protein n=1 Tax=Naegleria lovaniensis TaxID=51637 RepID=A0AA88H5K5_NAELO|nr:uncharacterized protein C9374_003653 [Naegleria lovaniensis]KAG2393889.1 hypothetical protein C9374_003653 [Naegleria lovaniensis]